MVRFSVWILFLFFQSFLLFADQIIKLSVKNNTIILSGVEPWALKGVSVSTDHPSDNDDGTEKVFRLMPEHPGWSSFHLSLSQEQVLQLEGLSVSAGGLVNGEVIQGQKQPLTEAHDLNDSAFEFRLLPPEAKPILSEARAGARKKTNRQTGRQLQKDLQQIVITFEPVGTLPGQTGEILENNYASSGADNDDTPDRRGGRRGGGQLPQFNAYDRMLANLQDILLQGIHLGGSQVYRDILTLSAGGEFSSKMPVWDLAANEQTLQVHMLTTQEHFDLVNNQKEFSLSHLPMLLKVLAKVRNDSFRFGLKLGIKYEDLGELDFNHKNNKRLFLAQVLIKWLGKDAELTPTLETLKQALMGIDRTGLAREIESNLKQEVQDNKPAPAPDPQGFLLSSEYQRVLLDALQSSYSDWYVLGIMLEIPYAKLDVIATDNPGNTEHCFQEVITIWKQSPDASIPQLLSALSDIEQGYTVKTIKDINPPSDSLTPQVSAVAGTGASEKPQSPEKGSSSAKPNSNGEKFTSVASGSQSIAVDSDYDLVSKIPFFKLVQFLKDKGLMYSSSLGASLGVNFFLIEANHPNDLDRRLTETIRDWLKKSDLKISSLEDQLALAFRAKPLREQLMELVPKQ